MNIALAHFRVGETDGVSLEMEKWRLQLEKMGHHCIYIAGSAGSSKDGSTPVFIIEQLHYKDGLKQKYVDNCYRSLNDYQDQTALMRAILETAEQIETKLTEILRKERIDLLIPNNIWSLGWDLPAALAFFNAAKKTGVHCIAHHHDFYWERPLYQSPTCPFVQDMLKKYFPPKDPSITHCVINRIAKQELNKRHDVDAVIVPNVFDFDAEPWQIDPYNDDLRQRCGIGKNDLVFLQATRICQRKGIELAIDVLSVCNERRERLMQKTLYNGRSFPTGGRIVLLLAGMNEDAAYAKLLRKHAAQKSVELVWAENIVGPVRMIGLDGTKVYSLWDAYTAADFVTYPSQLEGFGNQLLEGVFAKKPELIYEYPVYHSDLKESGFDFVTLGDKAILGADGLVSVPPETVSHCAEEIIDLLTDADLYEKMTAHNFSVGKNHYSYGTLYEILSRLLEHC